MVVGNKVKSIMGSYIFYAILLTFSDAIVLFLTVVRKEKLREQLTLDITFLQRILSDNFLFFLASVILIGTIWGTPLLFWKYLNRKHPNVAIVVTSLSAFVIMVCYAISLSTAQTVVSLIKDWISIPLGLLFFFYGFYTVLFEIYTRKGGLK